MSRVQLRHKLPKLPKRKLSLRKQHKRKQQIWIYNDGNLEQERICPERWMRLIYENPVGGASLLWLVKRKAVSRMYGLYCRTPLSAKVIPKFIKQYDINMDGCNGQYKNFAQFFSREKEGVAFPQSPSVLGSPCEGLVSVFDNIKADHVVLAKGASFSLAELFGDSHLAKAYEGGTMVSIRLTPAHYHRMHFFDSGTVANTRMIKGDLYSVSPLALNRVVRLYCRNKRAVINFATNHFGDVVLVEVGATFVGSIVHCFKDGQQVERSQVASYFKPGGSLVLMFLKKGQFTPDQALTQRTAQGYETKVAIGEPLGANL
ncbi:MAG: phosphatidylserine decarboxylase [Defluviitaleaceae bacterium]|nr:phosphatidylserine decarboxylase [Defluviitaleaceae bacterium]